LAIAQEATDLKIILQAELLLMIATNT